MTGLSLESRSVVFEYVGMILDHLCAQAGGA